MRALWTTLLAASVLAMPALAQDSTSTGTSVGDAPFATDATEQINTFVVDTVAFNSSWGNEYRVAPLIKSTKTGWDYLNAQLSGQGMSNTLLTDHPFALDSYDLWTAPRFGANGAMNLAPTESVNTAGWSGNQFAVGFVDYGRTQASVNSSNIVGAVVDYDPSEPERLYVARVHAAVNLPDVFGSEGDRSQFGFGSVDSHGNLHFRADGYNTTGIDPLIGQHYFRVHMPSRAPGMLNLLDLTGANMDPFPATCWVVDCFGCADTHSVPSIVPEQLGGPALIGADFNSQYVYETSGCPNPAVVYTTAHLAPQSTDQRGSIGFSHLLACGDSVGTAGMLAFDAANRTRILNLWRVAANGSVVTAPGSPIALDPTLKLGLPGGRFDGYHSTQPYRGGNGLIAIGEDQQGRGLAAATWYYDADERDADNAILVARFDCGDPNPDNAEWTIAVEATEAFGSPILDGPAGTPIGELTRRYSNQQYVGPSLSPPAMDSVGNIYFLSPCRMYGPDLIKGTADDYFPYSLLRAVYHPDAFTYQLELLIESGSGDVPYGAVLHGRNSDTDYKVTWLTIAQQYGRLSSGSLFSNNILQTAFNGVDPSNLPTASPRTLGGLVFQASIIYDVNDDGEFSDIVGGADEQYTVLLYVAPGAGPAICHGDLNCDGFIDFGDINPFVLALANWPQWLATHPDCPPENADVNADGEYGGQYGFGDINPFVTLIASGGGQPIPCD